MKTEKSQLSVQTKVKEEESKEIEPFNIKDKDLNSINDQQEINMNNEEQLENELSQERNNDNQNQEEENKNQEENESQNADEDLKFKFKEKLLTNEVHRVYGNRLREDYKYDNEGENGLFEASPRILKILDMN